MSDELNRMLKSIEPKEIHTFAEIHQCMENLCNVKCIDLKPRGKNTGSPYNYFHKTICEGYYIDTNKCMQEALYGEILFLLYESQFQMGYFSTDFEVEERKNVIFPWFISAQMVRMLSAANKPIAVKEFKSIKLKSLKDFIEANSNEGDMHIAKELIDQIMNTANLLANEKKDENDQDMTIKELFSMLDNKFSMPWMPGIMSIKEYEKRMIKYIQVGFQFAGIFSIVLNFCARYNLRELLDKYSDITADVFDDIGDVFDDIAAEYLEVGDIDDMLEEASSKKEDE